jgi:hypothetical protein
MVGEEGRRQAGQADAAPKSGAADPRLKGHATQRPWLS